MRTVFNPSMTLGQTAIEDIQLDASCRDDIPAVLRGIQHIYCHETLREKVFALLQLPCFLSSRSRHENVPEAQFWEICPFTRLP